MKNKLLIFFAISLMIVSGFCLSLFYKNKNVQTITIYNTINGTATIANVTNNNNIKAQDIDGYTFDNFYLDSQFSAVADLSKPAAINSVLYAAYIQVLDNNSQIDTKAIGASYSGELSSQEFNDLLNYKKLKIQTTSIIDFDKPNDIVEELEIIGAAKIKNINNFSALKKVSIKNVQEVDNSFNNCNNLNNIEIDSVTVANSFCDSGCISCVSLSSNLANMSGSFYKTDILEIKSQSPVYSINSGVLYENKTDNKCIIKASKNITNFAAESNVTEIKDYAFYNCSKLKTATLNSSLEFIGEHAFEKSAIENVDMQNNYSPLTIKKYAFAKTSKLNNFAFSRWTQNIEDYAFYQSNIPSIDLSLCSILSSIKQYAFAYCTKLTSAKFKENLSTATNIQSGIFAGCTNLQSVQNIFVNSIESQMFYNCTNLQVITGEQITQNIGDLAFYNCQKLQDISILTNVQNIGMSAFEKCNAITNISFSGAKTILSKAFAGMKNLQAINLGNSAQQIDFSAFDNCDNLTSFYLAGANYLVQNDAVYSADMKNIVYYLKNSQNQNFEIPASVLNIDAKYLSRAKNLKQITSQSVEYIIENGALFCVTNGKTLVCYPAAKEDEEFICPSDTQIISAEAFANCANLKHITLSNNNLHIQNGAMQNLASLESITAAFIGESASNISTNFLGWFFGAKNCTENNQFVPQSLKSVTITEQSTFAEGVFYDCGKITTITIENIKHVSNHMFSGMNNLQTLVLNDAVQSFGKYALYDCRNLRQLYIEYYNNIIIDKTSFSSTSRVVTVNLAGITDYPSQFVAYREKFNKSNWNWNIL